MIDGFVKKNLPIASDRLYVPTDCSSVRAGAGTGVTATVPTSAPGSSITARASVVVEGVARPVGIRSPFLMAAAAGVAGRPPTDLRDALTDPGRPSVH